MRMMQHILWLQAHLSLPYHLPGTDSCCTDALTPHHPSCCPPQPQDLMTPPTQPPNPALAATLHPIKAVACWTHLPPRGPCWASIN
jgi:hypothetical protein